MSASSLRVRRILYAGALLRALAIGLMAVLIGLYCARLGFSPSQIGVVLSAALWGSALAALATMLAGRHVSERWLLVALTLLPAAGGAVIAGSDAFPAVAAAAFLGMINVHGRDRGAIPILEQAMFPATTTDADRTRVFARYNVMLDGGYAAGGLLAGLPSLLERAAGLPELYGMRLALGLFCALYLASMALYARLPARVATERPGGLADLTPESRPIVAKISALFLIDALAGGFIGTAIFAYFFAKAFGAGPGEIALLFAAGRTLSAFSHFAAAWLASRIGLVNTMVYTHIPSSLLLFTVASADSFGWAAFFFLAREALNEMDVPTRQSYVMAVVKPHERLAAAGITNLVRSGGWAVAPGFAGWLMQGAGLAAPLVVAAVGKIAYDLLLWREFRRVKPPEERSP